MLRAGERKDSRQATRAVGDVAEGAAVLISLSAWILGIDRSGDDRLLGFAVRIVEDSQGWVGKSIAVESRDVLCNG